MRDDRKPLPELARATAAVAATVPRDTTTLTGFMSVRRDGSLILIEALDERNPKGRHTFIMSADVANQLIVDVRECLNGVRRLF